MEPMIGMLLTWPLSAPRGSDTPLDLATLKRPNRAPLTDAAYATLEVCTERVIGISADATLLVTVDIYKRGARFRFRRRGDVELDLLAGRACVETDDPYLYLRCPTEEFAARHRVAQEANYRIVCDVVKARCGDEEVDRGFELFDSRTLGPLVRQAVDHLNAGKPTGARRAHKKRVYNVLTQYFQGGMTPEACYPHYTLSGARHQAQPNPVRPDPERDHAGSPKRGRPSALMRAGKVERTGMNVDDRVEEAFRRGTQVYLEGNPKLLIPDAFAFIEGRFFSCGKEIRNGHPAPILLAADERPTERQYRYWLQTQHDPISLAKKRMGPHAFNLTKRPMLDGAARRDQIPGPGHEFQVDATVADVYLVSSLHRGRIIGRPVIYLVVDAWSRLIVGMSVALEGPSWLGAMLALDNMAANKVAFCREYGVEIVEQWWPSHHLPKALKGDRGELLSPLADRLAAAFNIRLINTAPYRPDWKPYVERDFKLLHDLYIDKWVPGAVDDARSRPGKDYRLDAVMTLTEFRRYLIDCVIEYNTTHEVEDAMRSPAMIEDEVAPFPAELWRWGIANGTGALRKEDRDLVRSKLLRPGRAHVKQEGILFQGLRYFCEAAIAGEWAELAALGLDRYCDVVYDPRTTDEIYLQPEEFERPITCTLTERDHLYRGRDWCDIEDYRFWQDEGRKEREPERKATLLGHHAYRQTLIEESQALTNAQREAVSDTQRVRGIGEHRREERDLERARDAWRLGAEPPAPSLTTRATAGAPAAEDAYVTDTVALLRDARAARISGARTPDTREDRQEDSATGEGLDQESCD
jgi:hypothetical protein